MKTTEITLLKRCKLKSAIIAMYSPPVGGGCPIDRNRNWGKNKKYCSMYKKNLSELLPEFYAYKYSNL